MTPTQAKIEAFEEAKRIIEKNAGDVAREYWAFEAEILERRIIEDVDREIVRLRKTAVRPADPALASAPARQSPDIYRDFTGFGT